MLPWRFGGRLAVDDIHYRRDPVATLPLDDMRALLMEVYPQGVLEKVLACQGSDERKHTSHLSIAEMVVLSDRADPEYWGKLNIVLKAAVCGTLEENGQTSNFLVPGMS
jgi:hypothetical protein